MEEAKVSTYAKRLRLGMIHSLLERPAITSILAANYQAKKKARDAMPGVIRESNLIEERLQSVKPRLSQALSHAQLIRNECIKPRLEAAQRKQTHVRSQLSELELSFEGCSDVIQMREQLEDVMKQVGDLQKHEDSLKAKELQLRRSARDNRATISLQESSLRSLLQSNMLLISQLRPTCSSSSAKVLPSVPSARSIQSPLAMSARSKKKAIRELKESAMLLTSERSCGFLRVREWEEMYAACVEAWRRGAVKKEGQSTAQVSLLRLLSSSEGRETLLHQIIPKTARSTTAASSSRSLNCPFSPRLLMSLS